MDELFLMNSSTNVFIFGDTKVRQKDWLKYSGVTDRPGEVCYNFSISNKLTEMVNFPTRVSDCDFQGLAQLELFLSTDASVCSTAGNSDHAVLIFSYCLSNSKGYPPFHGTTYENCWAH